MFPLLKSVAAIKVIAMIVLWPTKSGMLISTVSKLMAQQTKQALKAQTRHKLVWKVELKIHVKAE